MNSVVGNHQLVDDVEISLPGFLDETSDVSLLFCSDVILLVLSSLVDRTGADRPAGRNPRALSRGLLQHGGGESGARSSYATSKTSSRCRNPPYRFSGTSVFGGSGKRASKPHAVEQLLRGRTPPIRFVEQGMDERNRNSQRLLASAVRERPRQPLHPQTSPFELFNDSRRHAAGADDDELWIPVPHDARGSPYRSNRPT